MNFFADFRARWEAIEQLQRRNQAAYMPSPVLHDRHLIERGQLCRELAIRLAQTFEPAEVDAMLSRPQLAELIEAARLVKKSEPELAAVVAEFDRLANEPEET